MSQTLEALVVELRADVKGLQTSLQTAAGDVRRFSDTAEKNVNGFQAAIMRARTAVLSLGLAYAGFRVGSSIIDAGVQMEAMRNKMVAATGDARVAGDALAYVRAEANRLGLDIRSASDGFAGFSASSLRAGLTLQQTKDIFTGVSEAAVSMRLPAEQVSLVFKALEQMAGKGTVSMEELRGQLGDALPGAFEIAAKAMGKTTAEFSKMVGNGEVLAYDFLPKFGEAIRKELGGSVDEASQGAQAAFNRLGNAFFDLRAQMANSGFLDAITGSVNQLTSALNDPATVEGLKSFASLIGDVVEVSAKAAAAIGNFYKAAMTSRDEYLAQAEKAQGNGEWFVGVGEMNKRVDQERFRQKVLADYAAKTKANRAAAPDKVAGFGSYTLGTPAKPVPSTAAADKAVKAREQAQNQAARAREQAQAEADRMREQLGSQVQGMRYGFANPSDQAAMDVESQQKLLKEALEAKAITEQEFRDLSLEAETEYQDRLKEIRDNARNEELSALEGFLGMRIRSQQELSEMSLKDQAQTFRTTISEAAKHNQAFFMLEKAAALARALIAARESVVSAYAFGSRIGGPPLGAVFAGVAAAAQAVNIASIASTSFNGGGSNVSSSGGGGGAATSAVDTMQDASSSPIPEKSVYITLSGTDEAFYSKNSIRKLLEGINDAIGDGSKLRIAVGA